MTIQAVFLILALAFISWTPPAEARSCGAGCRRSMGSCSVQNNLWNAAMAAREQGVRVTSCCRSPQYNARLRSCGYFPSPRSSHMTGQAVDLIVSPRNCNSRYLGRFGFKNVCPHYHHGHCHVQVCGNARSRERARERAQDRARQIRQRNYRETGWSSTDFIYNTNDSWWPYAEANR